LRMTSFPSEDGALITTRPRSTAATELDRVGLAHADLCRDLFSRAVTLELSFFEAAYTT